MPIKSKAQLRACYAKKRQDKKSSWDCKKSLKTPYADLPEYVEHTGPRGGKYIIKNGRKIYT